jgi:quercetin dioxygenase-like cupin family protein
MTPPYTHFLHLAKEVQPPDKGILSRTLFNDDCLKAVLLGFAQGEELSEHTASMPAVLHFLQGRGEADAGRRYAGGHAGHLGSHAQGSAAQHPGEDAGGHALLLVKGPRP